MLTGKSWAGLFTLFVLGTELMVNDDVCHSHVEIYDESLVVYKGV